MNGIFKHLFGWWKSYRCSFCGKRHDEVANLIEGPGCYICNNCVEICSDVLIKECGDYRERFGAKAAALHREALEDQLRWLEEQRQRGRLSEPAYAERKRDLLKARTKPEPGAAPKGGLTPSPGSSGPTGGPPSAG